MKNKVSLPLKFIREYPYPVIDITITTRKVCVVAMNKEFISQRRIGAVDVLFNIAT
ncbi:hypothetical protein GCM10010912_62480 [Paenibacillus albidus]|uniref:Uncharacterized protein n=1 Tax=Paenibacillus albidus TaxID=2041023 RepID=A0A917D3F9_9BACL|nr:hypothetical protein GCM10010912_62480 [Paenibacillus albidus]